MGLADTVLRLFSKRPLARSLIGVLLLVSVAAAINLFGIRVVGTIHGWDSWLRAHSRWFFCWRLCVYGLTAYGWWRMRARMTQHEPAAASRRLHRVEIAAGLTVLAFEGALLIHPG